MKPAVTSGGADGTSGRPADGRASSRAVIAAVAALTLPYAVVNSLTTLDDYRAAGLDVQAWEPWVWELGSAVFWIAVAVPLVAILRRLRPPLLRWPASLAAHVALSLPVCALHLGWFAASRGAVYALLGSTYEFDWELIYEWRKDLLSVLIFAAMAHGLDRWSDPPPAPTPLDRAPTPFRLEVRDGPRTRWLAPAEIERVEAAGNYVELHTNAGPLLHRATLAAVEDQLGSHGFVRIHRSRLIRRDTVTAVETTQAGDFTVRLASGAEVAGSRRFRSGL